MFESVNKLKSIFLELFFNHKKSKFIARYENIFL